MKNFRHRNLIIFGTFFAFLALWNREALTNPPFWDDILGLHQQALFLARHHFSYAELAASGNFWTGGSLVYRWNILPWIYGGLYALLPPPAVHLAGHLINLGCLAGSATLLFRLLRRFRCPPFAALAWSAAMLATPLMAAQSAALGQEPPLIFAGTLLLDCVARRRIPAALGCVALIGAIKLVAVIPAVALLLYLPLAAYVRGEHCRRCLGDAAIAGALAVLGGGLLILDSDGAERAPGGEFWTTLWLKGIEHFTQYFPLTGILLGITLFGTLWYALRGIHRRRLGPLTGFAVFPLLLLGGFWASYLAYSVPLPRYAAFAEPPLFLLLALLCPRRLKFPAGVVLFGTGLLLASGAFYPQLPPTRRYSGEYLERSREFLVQLQRDRELCRRIEQQLPDTPIVAKWPYIQMLGDPAFGYVEKAHPRLFCAGILPRYLPEVQKFHQSALAKSPNAVYIFACNSFEFFRDFGAPLAPAVGDRVIFAAPDREAPLLLYQKGNAKRE